MTTDLDPTVAVALDRLVAGVDSDPDVILRRASTAAEGVRRRRAVRLRRTAVIAIAALALLAGAPFAASKFDVFDWLDQSGGSSATFSIDSSRTYRGPAPQILICPNAGAGSFSCSVGSIPSKSRRTYELTERVEARPQLTRQFLIRGLASAEQKGQVDEATAQRIRRDIDAVGDDFFSVLALVNGIETIASGQEVPGRPGFELVPPAGVPMWAACESSGETFRCQDLASRRNVAAGTPLYLLRSSSDWVASRRHPQKPVRLDRLFRAVLGRGMTPAEGRLLTDVLRANSASHGSSRPGVVKPQKSCATNRGAVPC